MAERVIRNADVVAMELGVPTGHQHLRLTLYLADGDELVLQEATLANLVRGYVTVKTHPLKNSLRLTGVRLPEGDGRRPGFAEWQLLEP